MARLDRHIFAVRQRLMLRLFVDAWAWTGLILGATIWIAIIAERTLDQTLGHRPLLFWVGVGLSGLAAFVYSMGRRPSAATAAVAIDETLGMKERYSSAMYARAVDDPFAKAVVADAQKAADSVSLYKRFPVAVPRQTSLTALVFLGALLTAWLMPPLHLFAKSVPTPPPPKVDATAERARTEKLLKEQLPKIEEATKLLADNTDIRKAADDLTKAMKTKEGDELHSRRSTVQALEDYKKAMLKELAKNQQFQTVQNEQKELSSMDPASDESTPIGKAQNQIKAGDLDSAMANIAKAVNDFDKLSAADKAKTLQQAKQLANALSKAANDPHVQQKIQQQLQQMGASQQMAQKMAQTMQQAASGNQQAQQQLQQMAQQMSQQMNKGQGPTQQQQQQIQQMMKQAQALATSQSQAAAVAQSAKQLAGAMGQAQQASQSKGGQQSQPGGGTSKGSGAMAQAQQNLQKQLQQMQAQAKDAQAMKAGADAAAQAAADAASGLSGDSGDSSNPNANGSGGSGNNGKNPNAPKGNHAGQGKGLGPGGAKMGIAESPFGGFKQELDPSVANDKGRVLASRYVKAGIDPGHSTAGLKDVAAAAQQDAPDEIDQDRVGRDAQQAVKDYFTAMQRQDGQ